MNICMQCVVAVLSHARRFANGLVIFKLDQMNIEDSPRGERSIRPTDARTNKAVENLVLEYVRVRMRRKQLIFCPFGMDCIAAVSYYTV